MSRANTIQAFALELGKIVSKPYGDNFVLHEIFATLFNEPLTAAHQTACKAARVSVGPDDWLKVLAGNQPSNAKLGLAAVAANNIAKIVSSSMQVSAIPPPNVSLPVFKQTQIPKGFPTTQKPDFRNPNAVVRALQAFGSVGAKEMMTLPARLVIGQAIQAAALLTPGVRSQAGLGQKVHKRLQEEYLLHTAGLETVVDRLVFGPKFAVYPSAGKSLSEAAAVSGRPVLIAMQLAWLTKTFDSYLRADVTSITLRQNWEIKPVGSTVSGILQEAWYRCSFNWVAKMLKQENPAFETDLQELEPGGSWPPPVITKIVLPAPSGAQGQLIVPFSLPLLPGLILYAGVSGPTVADATLLILYLMYQIDNKVKTRGKPILDGLAHAREVIAEAAGWVFAFVIILLLVIVLVIVAIVVFNALEAASAALVVPAGIAQGMVALGSASATASLILFVYDKLSQKEDPITGVNFGPINIALPASKVPQFIAMYEVVMSKCYSAFCGVLNMKLSEVSILPVT